MSDQNLFLPICMPLLLLFVLIVAIFGMKARFRFANRLHNAYGDKKRIDNWLETHGSKQRLRLLVSLTSILGTIIMGALIISGILVMSKIIVVIFITLILLTIISGTLMLIDLQRFAK